MSRKIILLSDGTGNSSAKVWRTNVWRVFESLDLSGSDQIAAYDDGVGTSSFKPAAILGGAFGFGLKRNVIDLYKFACRNHRNDDDEIFGFGFSRGAFTMRIVIGLIVEQGLVRAKDEAELNRKARAAYRAFRRNNFHTIWRFPEVIARWLRDLVVVILVKHDYSKSDNNHRVKIPFLGLWDFVAAYGTPVEEMTRGISQWLFPLLIPKFDLDPRVKRACHALSIDDERTTFHPILWDERDEDSLVPDKRGKRYLHKERISQVWFAGVHSNVGGGYPDDSLAQIPLIWIMSEAARAGLTFKSQPEASPQTLDHPHTAEDKDGRIYDPRKGLGGYYRYGPRDLYALGKELLSRKGQKPLPKIHESALARIKNNAHLYAPKGIPVEYEVVTYGGEVLPPQKNPYEKPKQARARANIQEAVWNIVWLRRIVYFLTVFVSVYLAAFPLSKALPRAYEFETSLRWVSDGLRMIGALLPSAARPWLDGYARNPWWFVAIIAVLIFLLWLGSRLARRIDNNLGIAWSRSLAGKLGATKPPGGWIYKLRTSKPYRAGHYCLKRYLAPAGFAFFFVYTGIGLTNRALYTIQDDIGLTCSEIKKPQELAPGETLLVRGSNSKPVFLANQFCQNMDVLLEEGARYRIVFRFKEEFRDGSIDVNANGGFYSNDPQKWYQRIFMTAAVPFRRELIRPWFRIVARIGSVGGEENFFDPDPKDGSLAEVITAPRDGQLFLFVNDAVSAIWGHYGIFYDNNGGAAEVTVTRQKPCFDCVEPKDLKPESLKPKAHN